MATRVNYNTILNKYKALGKGNVRLTRSTLYLSKPISTSSTTYSFDVLETQNSTLATNELRVNLNDEFICTSIGVYIETLITDKTNNVVYGTKLLPYAPMQLKSTFAGLTSFWNGALQIAVNNIIYLDKFDTAKCQVVPRTQENPASAATTILNAVMGSTNFGKDGMIEIEPMLVLSGAKKNTITLSLPAAITAPTVDVAVDSGTITLTAQRVVFVARGLNAMNGASFQS
jgi:hypothetical protein